MKDFNLTKVAEELADTSIRYFLVLVLPLDQKVVTVRYFLQAHSCETN